jgi:hypothetical protein
MPGVSVQDQDPNMSDAMADFIIDSIIVTKVRNGGNESYMATDLKEKFEIHFSGKWLVFITKNGYQELSDWDVSDGSTYIIVQHGAHLFLVMQTLQYPIG